MAIQIHNMYMLDDRQLREVFHLCFLERLLKISDPLLYVLKDGVNLRFFFHSPRYSEDMDIDVLGGSVATLKKNGYKILADASFKRSLQTYGIADLEVNDPAKAKQTTVTQRFRVRIHTVSGNRLPSKIEFSRRASRAATTKSAAPQKIAGVADERTTERVDVEITRCYRKLSFPCQHYSGSAAVAQKLQALMGRPVTQARDVFDLHILLLGGNSPANGIANVLAQQQRAAALDNLMSLSYEDFGGQVVEFLDDDAKNRFANRASWHEMVEQVLNLLQPSP